MNPLVSVLTPAYNAEKYLDECIKSILEQSYNHFEYIIIDDGSTDGTWDVLKRYAALDSRIKIFQNEVNLGIAGTRNRLKSKASGKYIMWQDADDISMPTRMKEQLSVLESNPKVGIVGGSLQFFNGKGDLNIRKYSSSDTELRRNIFRYSPVAQPGAMIRKTALDEAGDYDLNYPPAEDLDMSFRIGKNYIFSNLQTVVLKYRESENGATFTKLKTMELNTISIRLRYSSSKFYHMTFSDHVYNIAQYVSIFLIPPQLKISLFNLLRNSTK